MITGEQMKNREEFKRELQDLINKFSLESSCNMPDFIIADFLVGCFDSFVDAIRHDDKLKWTYYQSRGGEISK